MKRLLVLFLMVIITILTISCDNICNTNLTNNTATVISDGNDTFVITETQTSIPASNFILVVDFNLFVIAGAGNSAYGSFNHSGADLNTPAGATVTLAYAGMSWSGICYVEHYAGLMYVSGELTASNGTVIHAYFEILHNGCYITDLQFVTGIDIPAPPTPLVEIPKLLEFLN